MTRWRVTPEPRSWRKRDDVCGYCQTATAGQCQTGLWSRDTQWGADGYYGELSYDTLVNTSFHVLTTDGITGRDVMGAK